MKLRPFVSRALFAGALVLAAAQPLSVFAESEDEIAHDAQVEAGHEECG